MPDIVKIRSLPSASDLSDGDYAAIDNSTDGLRKVALGGIISDLKSDLRQLGNTVEASPSNYNSSATDVDLDITDEDGNVLVRLEDGHIKTKNFDSSDVAEELSQKVDSNQGTVNSGKILGIGSDGEVAPRDLNVPVNTPSISFIESESDLDITDEGGNVLARLSDGGVKTKLFDSAYVNEFITNMLYSSGNRLANPLYTTREFYNSENPESAIAEEDVLVAGITGNANYRIPAICITNAGTVLVAGTHMTNAAGDYGDFSIDVGRKAVGGTWSVSVVIPFDNTRQDYGSVLNNEFLVDRTTGRIYLFYGTEKQKVVWWEVTTSDGDFRYVYSDNDGETWSAPVSLKSLWDTETYDYCIPSCTKGITLTNGTFVVPCFCKKGSAASTAQSYPLLLIKKPSGSWYFSSVASVEGINHLDECAVVEGSNPNEIWLYCRPNTNYGTGVKRGYNKFSYNMTTNKFTHLTCTFDGNRASCFSLDKITIDGSVIYLMSYIDSNVDTRVNITLWASLDGDIWTRIYRIYKPSGNGYSVLDNYNGSIGVAYEKHLNGVGCISYQDLSVLSALIKDSVAKRNVSIQDRMQMIFNSAKGID